MAGMFSRRWFRPRAQLRRAASLSKASGGTLYSANLADVGFASQITFKNSESTWPTSSGTQTLLGMPGLQTGGAMVAAVLWNSTSATITSFVDDDGNTWNAQGGPQNGVGAMAGWRTQFYSAANTHGGALTTATITFSAALTRRGVAIAEYIGADQINLVDVNTVYGTQTATTTFTATLTTLKAGDGVVAAVLTSGAINQTAAGVDSPFSQRENSNFGGNSLADTVAGAPGSVTATFHDVNPSNDGTTGIIALAD